MDRLALNDGTVLEDASAILSEDLFLYLNGLSLIRVFQLMCDPARTRRIVYKDNAGQETTFLSYTRLIAVRDEGDGLVTAVLRKDV